MSTIKQELTEIMNALPDDASWQDLVYQLYAQGKIDFGLSEEERQQEITREQFDNLCIRAESAHDMPEDMRNTLIYHPGNMTTMGIVAGVISAAFAFVFPPISWIAAPIALLGGLLGLVARQKNAWVAILLAAVTTLPFIPMFLK